VKLGRRPRGEGGSTLLAPPRERGSAPGRSRAGTGTGSVPRALRCYRAPSPVRVNLIISARLKQGRGRIMTPSETRDGHQHKDVTKYCSPDPNPIAMQLRDEINQTARIPQAIMRQICAAVPAWSALGQRRAFTRSPAACAVCSLALGQRPRPFGTGEDPPAPSRCRLASEEPQGGHSPAPFLRHRSALDQIGLAWLGLGLEVAPPHDPALREQCARDERALVTTKRGTYGHHNDGVEVWRIFRELRSHAIDIFNGHFKAVFDCGGHVPTQCLSTTRRFVLGAVLVYQLGWLQRFETGKSLHVALTLFLRAA
jgi:hypothetical protein